MQLHRAGQLIANQRGLLVMIANSDVEAAIAPVEGLLLEHLDKAKGHLDECWARLSACTMPQESVVAAQPDLLACAMTGNRDALAGAVDDMRSLRDRVPPPLRAMWNEFITLFSRELTTTGADMPMVDRPGQRVAGVEDARQALSAFQAMLKACPKQEKEVHMRGTAAWLSSVASAGIAAATHLRHVAEMAALHPTGVTEEDVKELVSLRRELEQLLQPLLLGASMTSKAYSKMTLMVTSISATLVTSGFCRQEGDDSGRNAGMPWMLLLDCPRPLALICCAPQDRSPHVHCAHRCRR